MKMDGYVKKLSSTMSGHPGYDSCTRYVCKSEWAYEMSFIFKTPESFGAWKESALRDEVHATYLAALDDCGLKEEDIYAGARVHDKL